MAPAGRRHRRRVIRASLPPFFLATLALALASCGGPGDGDAAAALPVTPPAAADGRCDDGCAATAAGQPAARDVAPFDTLADLDRHAGDAESRIRLSVGQTLQVHLPASPATGHAWELEGAVPALLDMETDPGPTPQAPGGQARADGVQTWRLRAVRPGRILLRFVYRHRLDAGTGPAHRASFVIDVVDAIRPGAAGGEGTSAR